MGGTFFVSWELWEKMTFVLGVAIAGVFCVGYGKLLWRNRLVKKQEIVDEEKRTRIEQLRESGQLIDSRKHDVPFGVRAIQSGIQVDGIWISNTTTPIPSQLNLSEIPTTQGSDSSKTARNSQTSSQNMAKSSPSGQGRSPLRSKSPLGINPDDASYDQPGDTRNSYQPRKSSYLRYGSYGETPQDDDTLAHLEGKSAGKKVHTHRPRGSRQVDLEADASAADNEHSSEASSDSDVTLSSNLHPPGDRKNRYSPGHNRAPGERSRPDEGAPILSSVPSGIPVIDSFPFQSSSRSEYTQVPLVDSPYSDGGDPFLTPDNNEMDRNPFEGHYMGSSNMAGTYQPLEQVRDDSHPPFVPGELHQNKSVRKVNSGFELLPAGTFGVSTNNRDIESNTDGRYNSVDENGERRQAKLQKKPRTSISGRQASGGVDRI